MQWPAALVCLRHRDVRLLLGGQAVSLVGSWMQSVAQAWLVWELTGSERMLGLVGFLTQIPVLLLGTWAGSLADRLPRRRIVVATQVNALVQATVLAVLTLSGAVRPWMILPLSAMLGLSYAFEIPARQSLLGDLAGEDMPNAIALNASIVNATRIVGPAVAGVVVATMGPGVAFAVNASSFLVSLRAILSMEARAPRPHAKVAGAPLAAGFGWAWRTRRARGLLLLLAASSVFGMSYVALMPVVASRVLGGGPRLFGLLQSSAGVGALAGGIVLMTTSRGGAAGLGRRSGAGALLLGAGVLGAGLSRTPWLTSVALLVAGLGYVTQTASTMTWLQAVAPPEMKGRMMGIFSTVFVGLAPFGALAGGLAAARFGVPATLVAGALVVLASAAAFHLALPGARQGSR